MINSEYKSQLSLELAFYQHVYISLYKEQILYLVDEWKDFSFILVSF